MKGEERRMNDRKRVFVEEKDSRLRLRKVF